MRTSTPADGIRRPVMIVLLGGATTLAAAALGCATPYPAIAAMAALHMRSRDGVAFILFAWAVAQTIGFGLRDHPYDASALGLAASVGGAALVGLLGAAMLIRHTPVTNPIARAVVALIGAFAAFKGAVLVPSLLLADSAHGFTADVLTRQAVRNMLFLAGLLALHRIAVLGFGLPVARKLAVRAR